MRELVLPAGENPTSLEGFLKKRFPIGYVRKIFRKHGVRINDRRAKSTDPVRPGDRVQLYIPFEREPSAPKPARSAPSVDIVFEDDALLVINKRAGVAVHEGKSVLKRETLLGRLEEHYRERGIRPRLVHRLDRDTSGLLLIAKNRPIAEELETLFETRAVDKEYVCLVAGRLQKDSGGIDFPLPGREGKPVRAVTRFQTLKRFSQTTLVRVATETGRLHQIRLHFAKLGYPVVMDDQHGDFAFNKRFRKQYGLKRQFLHAHKLRLTYACEKREWTAPLPPDLEKTINLLSAE